VQTQQLITSAVALRSVKLVDAMAIDNAWLDLQTQVAMVSPQEVVENPAKRRKVLQKVSPALINADNRGLSGSNCLQFLEQCI